MRNDKLKRRGRETRDRILDAAFTVFAQRGFQAASVDEITNVAGNSKGAFYYHFASKESVFLELLSTYVFPKLAETSRTRDITRSTMVALLMEFWVNSSRRRRVKDGLLALYESRVQAMLPDFEGSAIPKESIDELCRTIIAVEDGLLIQEALGFPRRRAELERSVRQRLAAFFSGPENNNH